MPHAYVRAQADWLHRTLAQDGFVHYATVTRTLNVPDPRTLIEQMLRRAGTASGLSGAMQQGGDNKETGEGEGKRETEEGEGEGKINMGEEGKKDSREGGEKKESGAPEGAGGSAPLRVVFLDRCAVTEQVLELLLAQIAETCNSPSWLDLSVLSYFLDFLLKCMNSFFEEISKKSNAKFSNQ